jgi:hypothetical protein
VKTLHRRDEFRASGGAAGELESGFIRLGARVTQPDVLGVARRESGKAFSERVARGHRVRTLDVRQPF